MPLGFKIWNDAALSQEILSAGLASVRKA